MKKIISIFTIMLLFVAYTQAQTAVSGNEGDKVEQVTPVRSIDANIQIETQKSSSSTKSCSSKKMKKSCSSKSRSAMKSSSHCTDKSKAVGSEQSSDAKTKENKGLK
jgi:hypothetical protein